MPEADQHQVVLKKAVQVGVVVRDIETTMRLLTELFGIGPFRVIEWPTERPDMRFFYKGEPGNLRMRLAFAQIGLFELELIQPLDGDSDYHHFLATKGEGLHHILFDVENADEIIAALANRGVGVLQTGTGLRPGTRWTYLDTAEKVGFSIELRNIVPGSDGTSPVAQVSPTGKTMPP